MNQEEESNTTTYATIMRITSRSYNFFAAD